MKEFVQGSTVIVPISGAYGFFILSTITQFDYYQTFIFVKVTTRGEGNIEGNWREISTLTFKEIDARNQYVGEG